MRTKVICTVALTVMLIVGIFAPSVVSSVSSGELFNSPEGWSEDVRLTNNTTNDVKASIDAIENDIHIVWHHTVTPGEEYQIFYMNSNDGGYSWGLSTQISSSDLDANNPDVSVNDDDIHIVWDDTKAIRREIFYRHSEDGGDTWLPEQMISSDDGYNSVGPTVFVKNSNVHISWMDLRDGDDGEIYYRRSVDGGETFDNGQGDDSDRRITYAPAEVTQTKMAGHGYNISVTWCDRRHGNWQIYWMISKDNGFTWEDGLGNEYVGRRISETTSDSVVSAMSVYDSNIHIVWVEEVWPGPDYYLYYRRSTDNGMTWGAAELLVDSQYSHAPDIDVVGDTVHVVWHDWRDDGSTTEVYYKNSTDGGISWSDDLRLTYNIGNHSSAPKMRSESGMIHIVWRDDRDGNNEIYYKRNPDFNDEPIPEFGSIVVPVIIVLVTYVGVAKYRRRKRDRK